MRQEDVRVLIIDDEIIIARDIEGIIKSLDYINTKVCITSEQALIVARDFLPHIIFCDINLNDKLDGIDCINLIKSYLITDVIYVTGYSDNKLIERAKQTRPINYIVKPFQTNKIKAAMNINFGMITEKNGTLKPDNLKSLTVSEKIIIHLISKQKTTKQMSVELFVSVSTIETHRHNIANKLKLPKHKNNLLMWALSNQKDIESKLVE